MLILKYPAKTQQINELEGRLKKLSLAYQTDLDPAATAPVLIEGKITFTGAEEINQHLDELAKELYFWQYCSCARVDA